MIVFFAALVIGATCPVKSSEGERLPSGKKIINCPIPFGAEREKLTLEYRCAHQNVCGDSKIEPRVIVLHHTATKNFASAYRTFARTTMDPGRKQLLDAGEVNVSAHFLVDRDGTIYRLMPEEKMARHAIGLNHVAIGVENVGGLPKVPLTEKQAVANAELVRWLVAKYPRIRWLLGHHEARAMERTELFLERDPNYRTQKVDPGPEFMSKVRSRLADLDLSAP